MYFLCNRSPPSFRDFSSHRRKLAGFPWILLLFIILGLLSLMINSYLNNDLSQLRVHVRKTSIQFVTVVCVYLHSI